MRNEFPRHVEGARLIEASPEVIWAVLSDFHRVDRWAPLVTRVRPLGTVPSGPGMGRRCQLRRLGRVDEVVNVWEPLERIGYRVTPLGPVDTSQSLWELESNGAGGTHVRLRLSYGMRFGIVGRLLDAFAVRRILARSLEGALALLRRHVLESGDRASAVSSVTLGASAQMPR